MRIIFCRWSAALAGAAVLAGGLAGCTTVVESPLPAVVNTTPPAYEPPAPVYVQPAPVYLEPAPQSAAVVVIQADSDFYEPLNPYGRWIDVAGNGRCWVPSGVGPDWRPYTNGRWERTDAGWYWVSNEHWGWATYHYGRWYQDPDHGWVWAPQTQWAPAWVAWRSGGGYSGWAPLPPAARPGVSGGIEVSGGSLSANLFVFVDNRRMLEPQRPQTVIINNTTIINQTVNITKIQVVNQRVINEGPNPEVIERATGKKIQVVAAGTLRTRQEAPAIARGKNEPATRPIVQPAGSNRAESAPPKELAAGTTATRPATPEARESTIDPYREKPATAELKTPRTEEAREPASKPAPAEIKPGQKTLVPLVKKAAPAKLTPEQKRNADERRRLAEAKSGSAPTAPPKSQP